MLERHYPADLNYASGVQIHYSRNISRLLFNLKSDGPTAVASFNRACDELLAASFERLSMCWNMFVLESTSQLSALVGPAVWATLDAATQAHRKVARDLFLRLRCDSGWAAAPHDRKRLHSSFPDASTLSVRLETQVRA